ncbi:hypothetical protein KHQ06_07310 [Nocardia tengchongensis]|uniref:HTH luxR-type domain-containing protein n=2 Tax=Nocardia tengchongensis TaxID=2055889 RepID=A0ABX8CXV8_9NOCA|nr:hypothetical protein KHQ06_07310 [Nocardia tengchongensis]
MVASAVASSGSRLTRMAELLGAAEALAATIGAMPVPFGMRWLTEAFGNAVATLDPAAFERHRRIGADRVQSDTAGYLAEVLDDLDVSIPHQAGKPLLTRREREVAALVARGRTNRQIARALGISERTAEVHVHNIAGKLGASGRAEVAVWFATDHALHGGEST